MQLKLVAAAALLLPATAFAAAYKDWTPQKSAIEVTTMEIDPNHVDDYLTGLHKAYLPCLNVLKKHGVIDDYGVTQRLNGGAGPNVMIWQHYPSLSVMEPDQARDQAIEKECSAFEDKKLQSEMDGYRKFKSDEIYTEVSFPK